MSGFYRGLERIFDHITGVTASAAMIASSPVLLEYINEVGVIQLLITSYLTMTSASICTIINDCSDEE